MRIFALTRSSNSSRVAFSFGKSPLCPIGQLVGGYEKVHEYIPRTRRIDIQREAISSSHRQSTFPGLVEVSGVDQHRNGLKYVLPPVGSASAGKMSLPQMAQAAAAVTIPANPSIVRCDMPYFSGLSTKKKVLSLMSGFVARTSLEGRTYL
jgi:hypothetical protein